MLGAAFSEALQFAMMTKVKTELASVMGVQKLEKQHVMYCAMLTGVINSIFLNPVELVKIQMQLVKKFESDNHQNSTKRVSVLKCMKNIQKNGGAKPFMRGLHATMARDFFFLPAFFGQYEVWKDKWANHEDTRII